MADLFFTKWRRWGAFLSIVMALLVPLLAAAKAWHDVNHYPVVTVKITGYDPRDFLYGHYMLYRFDWNWAKGQPDTQACYGSGTECCLCMGEDIADPSVSLAACNSSKAAACHAVIKGQYYGGEQFDIGHDRYYVSETRAGELEQLLRDEPGRFSMGLSLPPNRKPVIRGLYIDDVPVENYLRRTPVPAQD